jgi:hypothetical protein
MPRQALQNLLFTDELPVPLPSPKIIANIHQIPLDTFRVVAHDVYVVERETEMTIVTILQSGKFYLTQASGEEGPFGETGMGSSFENCVSNALACMADGGTLIYEEGDRSGIVEVTADMASPANTLIVAAKLRQDLMTISDRAYIAGCVRALDGPTGRRF